MTSQGSPHARLQRALASRNALVAWATASELPQVSLDDALALCLLLADSIRLVSSEPRSGGTRGCAAR